MRNINKETPIIDAEAEQQKNNAPIFQQRNNARKHQAAIIDAEEDKGVIY